ncbi:MAG: ATP-binding protein [Rikenellaceae bacterium]
MENIIIALSVLCLSLVATTLLLVSDFYLFAIPFAIIAVFQFIRVVTICKSSHKKIDFMFNALQCDDYNFSFSESQQNVDKLAFNALLNRIRRLLTDAKLRTIEQEKYYEYIFDKLNTAIVIINDKGNIFQANRAMYEMLEVDILGHINHIERISKTLSDAILSSSDGDTREVTISSPSGEKSYSIMASRALLNGKELKIVAISSLKNALDRKEIETWSKLTRILTHEIMNSLSPVTSLSQTLLTLNTNSEMQQGLETIVQTNKSLVSFVENYRSFTTIQKPEKHPFEIKPLLENLLGLICPNDIEYSLNVEPEDTMIFADENQVLQVVVNLLKNAVQAVENNIQKRIDVKVLILEDENIVVEVSNNGPQITPEVVDNLFTPFFTTRKGGKGVGLSISKRIMQLHGGSLSLSVNRADKVAFLLLFR